MKVVGTAVLPLRKLNRERGIAVDKHELLLMDMDKAPAVTVHANGTLTYLHACRLFKHDVGLIPPRRGAADGDPHSRKRPECCGSEERVVTATGRDRQWLLVDVGSRGSSCACFELATTAVCLLSTHSLFCLYTRGIDGV